MAFPEDLFELVGNELLANELIVSSALDFAAQRQEAERRTFMASSLGEYSLLNIYEGLAKTFDWSAKDMDSAQQKELLLEAQHLRPIPETRAKIKALRNDAMGISFISDMYLPAHFIEERLKEHGFLLPPDKLYVSCEHGCSKAKQGRLFDVMLENESISPNSVQHVGDDAQADVKMARMRGLQTVPHIRGRLSTRERALAKNRSIGTRLIRSKLAGASRLARLDCPHQDGEGRQQLWDMVCESVAPALVGFVFEVLKQANKQKIDRLLFVARDGQILHHIANFITTGEKGHPTLQYIYGSRLAWSPAAFLDLDEHGLEVAFRKARRLTVGLVFDRIGLAPKKLLAPLRACGLPPEEWHRALSFEECDRLKSLLRSQETKQILLPAAMESAKQACTYLHSLGIGKDENLGLVDLGWYGRLFASFDRLCATTNLSEKSAPQGFFFGVRALPPSVAGRSFGFLSSPNSSPNHSWIFSASTWLEAFTSADHGSTLRYEDSRPIMAPFPESNLGFTKTIQEAVLAYARHLCDVFEKEDLESIDWQTITSNTLRKLWEEPSKEEAEAFGNFSISPDGDETSFVPLAPQLRLSDALGFRLRSRSIEKRLFWPQGSWARSHPLVAFLRGRKQASEACSNKRPLAIAKSPRTQILTNRLFRLFKPKSIRRVVIFGAGKGGYDAMRFLSARNQIVALLDNDSDMHGSNIAGIPILAPDALPRLSFDKILIASMYSLSIYEQLIQLGVEEKKIEITNE